jgi:hypothetical protein
MALGLTNIIKNPPPRPPVPPRAGQQIFGLQGRTVGAGTPQTRNFQAERDAFERAGRAQQDQVYANRAAQASSGGGGGGSRNVPATEPPPPAAPRPLNWQDSSYNAQIAALDRALRDFETGASTRGQRYQEDFSTGLGRMGFRPAPQPMAMSALSEGVETPNTFGVSTGPLQGEFDVEGEFDRTSAAARGTRGMRDEFAGRGTLRSSDFAKSFADFQDRLNQQLTGMERGRDRFTEDLQAESAQFQARTGEQRAAAQEAATNRALMRQLSQMGF